MSLAIWSPWTSNLGHFRCCLIVCRRVQAAGGGGGGDADGGDFEGDFQSISEGGVGAAITAGPGGAAAVEVSGGGNAAAAEYSPLANGAVKASDLSREKLVELLSSRKKRGGEASASAPA